MAKKDKVKIVGSLSEGGLYSTACFVIIYAAFVLAVLGAFAVVIVSLAENNAAYLLAGILPAVLAVLIGYFVFGDLSKRIRCYRCLKDGVRVAARCEKVMATPPSFVKDRNKYIKICIKFEYKGKQKQILSGKAGYGGKGSLERAGFAAINASFANRDIEVIYSPSRQEVLFIADEKI